MRFCNLQLLKGGRKYIVCQGFHKTVGAKMVVTRCCHLGYPDTLRSLLIMRNQTIFIGYVLYEHLLISGTGLADINNTNIYFFKVSIWLYVHCHSMFLVLTFW